MRRLRAGRALTACLLVVSLLTASVSGPGPFAAAAPVPGGWLVTALGDSVTAGSACDCTAFVDTYATLTSRATGRPVTSRNLGVPGQTSTDLLADLSGDDDDTRSVAASDVVIVTTGANDFGPALDSWSAGDCSGACFSAVAESVHTTIAAIVHRIHALRAGHRTQILVTGYWNVFPDGEAAASLGDGYRAIADQATRLANTALRGGATGAGATYVDLYAPFKGDGSRDPTGLLAADGDHPNAAGHRLIAESLAAQGWKHFS